MVGGTEGCTSLMQRLRKFKDSPCAAESPINTPCHHTALAAAVASAAASFDDARREHHRRPKLSRKLPRRNCSTQFQDRAVASALSRLGLHALPSLLLSQPGGRGRAERGSDSLLQLGGDIRSIEDAARITASTLDVSTSPIEMGSSSPANPAHYSQGSAAIVQIDNNQEHLYSGMCNAG
eukprot:1621127-Pleurochrysis_carterae.AAC.3